MSPVSSKPSRKDFLSSLTSSNQAAADISLADLAGELELVSESLDHLLVDPDLRLEQLEGDFFFDLRVKDLADPAHSSLANFFYDLVAAGKGRTRGQFFDRGLKDFSFGTGGHDTEFRRIRFMSPNKPLPAVGAELRSLGIIKLTLGALNH